MKKGMIVVSAIVLFSMVGVGHAVETEYGDLGIDVDATWVSKYIWRGLDWYDDKAAFQPSINFDFFDTGLSLNVWASWPGASTPGYLGYGPDEQWHYTLTYANSILDGEQYKTNYAIGWRYYNFADMSNKVLDMQEFFAALSWPDICPAGIVPRYTAIWMWPSKSNNLANQALSALGLGDVTGWIHIFGLGYDLTVPGFLPDNPEQVLSFSADMVYNDGVLGVDHDWSHILWGVSTSIELPYGSLTPAVYYQTSMDDSVNTEDEFWVGISYGVGF